MSIRDWFNKTQPKAEPTPEPEPVENTTERAFFYIVERRVEGDQDVAVAVCKSSGRAVEGYVTLIDTAFAAPTYAVRLFRAPLPDGADPDSPDDATEAAFNLAQENYQDCEQVAAFVRVFNTVLVDINKEGQPHLSI